jgi:hypothetical protein
LDQAIVPPNFNGSLRAPISFLRFRCKSISIVCAVGMLFVIFALPSVGQSFDAASPSPVTSRKVEGELEPSGQSCYYTFEAGPGDVNVTVDGSTNYASSNFRCFVIDDQGHEDANFELSANSSGGTRAQAIHLLKRKKLVLKLSFALDVGIKVKYQVKLSGAVKFANSNSVAVESSSENHTVIEKDDQSSDSTESGASYVADKSIEQSVPIEDKFALIVGVSKFQDPKIDLKYSSKDAQDFANYLTTDAHFAKDHVRVLVDEQATKERVLEEIGDKWLPRVARPNDLVLIYVSSHGSPSQMDELGLNYLVMYNTNPDSLYATGLPMQDLAAAIRQRVHCNRVVLIIDACNSGATNTAKGITRVGNFDGKSLAQGTGQLVICSSAPNQVSWESKRYANGVFTRQLIKGLRSSSGQATLGQAFQIMKSSVLDEVLSDRKELQTPVMKSKWDGNDLIITLPPSQPHSVPDELR